MSDSKNPSPLTDNDIQDLLNEFSNCKMDYSNGVSKVIQKFKFSNYLDSLKFLLLIGNKIDSMQHHPKIICEWDHLTLEWWTHSSRTLTPIDALMVRETQTIFRSFLSNK
ncbi:4a-hydroxytetrahydrobiopterin dehydratase [Pectobacterium betavasculorum]|uniref:4a-hydroxytetrahydrobiopterin dehydratase n=1 Tax=Pectobacterium betavasculorum TaxID=55207 RepID=A0ABR4UZ12_9GAMM|nr:4a-hydroxytetrahydrobiopterin dehydratase [Pectobacterium betavasculorum]KFX20048.1 hypothetical protein JV35_11315 [Pectobacterium betavasculorum]